MPDRPVTRRTATGCSCWKVKFSLPYFVVVEVTLTTVTAPHISKEGGGGGSLHTTPCGGDFKGGGGGRAARVVLTQRCKNINYTRSQCSYWRGGRSYGVWDDHITAHMYKYPTLKPQRLKSGSYMDNLLFHRVIHDITDIKAEICSGCKKRFDTVNASKPWLWERWWL